MLSLLEHNQRQAARADALADALDAYLDASRAHMANIAAEQNRPQNVAPDIEGLQRSAVQRTIAARTLSARIQDCAGLTFTVQENHT